MPNYELIRTFEDIFGVVPFFAKLSSIGGTCSRSWAADRLLEAKKAVLCHLLSSTSSEGISDVLVSERRCLLRESDSGI